MADGAVTGQPLMTLAEVAAIRVAGIKDSAHEDERVRVAAVGLLRLCDTCEAFRAGLSRLIDEIEQNLGEEVRLSESYREAKKVLGR